jgi:hypothetical protein
MCYFVGRTYVVSNSFGNYNQVASSNCELYVQVHWDASETAEPREAQPMLFRTPVSTSCPRKSFFSERTENQVTNRDRRYFFRSPSLGDLINRIDLSP